MEEDAENKAINILIVEDNEDDLFFIKKALSDKLYEVQNITSGIDAYNYLLNPDIVPDIVLLDYQLPGMSGIEILEKINKQENPYSFIFLTIDNTVEIVIKAMKAGALDFIVKSTDLKNELPSKIEKVYEIHRNKIEKKKNERELLIAKERAETSEKKFRLLFDAITEGVALNEMIFNEQGEMIDYKILEVNKAFYKIGDFSSGNVIGNVATNLYGLSNEMITSFWKSHKEKNETSYIEMHWELGKKWFYISTTPFENNKFVTVFFDITKRKQAEKDLRDSQLQLQQITDNLPVLISQVDSKLKYIFVNKEYEKVFDTSKEEIIGKDIFNFINDDHQNKSKSYISKVLKGEKVVYETQLADKNKNPHFYTTTLIPNIIDQKTDGYFALIIDRTDSKIYESKLKESEIHLKELNATKDKFFRIIAHDLKGPFSGILEVSKVLVDRIDKYDKERIKVIADTINQSSITTFNLLENLLEWSMAQSGLLSSRFENLLLKNIMDEIISLSKNRALEKNISVKIEFPPDSIIYADKNMIHTILRNLISNAFKFTPINGTIIIRTKQLNNATQVSVSDTGVGMDNDTINKLFKITEKVSTMGTENEKGTGLGLILCKEFIEKHHGQIWVESELGKGSEFKFTLPLSKSE